MFPCSLKQGSCSLVPHDIFPLFPLFPCSPKPMGVPQVYIFELTLAFEQTSLDFPFLLVKLRAPSQEIGLPWCEKLWYFLFVFFCSCCGLIVLWALFSLLTSSVSLKGPHNENEARKLSNNHYFGTFKICVLTTLQTQWI